MKCPSCQHDNPAGMKFCVECGTEIYVHTPTSHAQTANETRVPTIFTPLKNSSNICNFCSSILAESSRFCATCGNPIDDDHIKKVKKSQFIYKWFLQNLNIMCLLIQAGIFAFSLDFLHGSHESVGFHRERLQETAQIHFQTDQMNRLYVTAHESGLELYTTTRLLFLITSCMFFLFFAVGLACKFRVKDNISPCLSWMVICSIPTTFAIGIMLEILGMETPLKMTLSIVLLIALNLPLAFVCTKKTFGPLCKAKS